MKSLFWRSTLLRRADFCRVATWLSEPGSLTARCQAACGVFRVRLLQQGRGGATADEIALLGPSAAGIRPQVRDVLLCCDGRAVIYAHTVLADAPRGRLQAWLARLGERSLGSLLFAYPGFQRGAIQFARLDARQPLYRQAVAAAGLSPSPPATLWARRSLHRLGAQRVLVSEVFLPALLELAHGR